MLWQCDHAAIHLLRLTTKDSVLCSPWSFQLWITIVHHLYRFCTNYGHFETWQPSWFFQLRHLLLTYSQIALITEDEKYNTRFYYNCMKIFRKWLPSWKWRPYWIFSNGPISNFVHLVKFYHSWCYYMVYKTKKCCKMIDTDDTANL